MRGEAMAQRVWVDGLFEPRSVGRLMTCLPNRFGIDRLIAAMILVAGKEPDSRLSPQAVPVLTELVEQLGAEHHMAVFAPLATLNVKDHTLAVDIPDFQVRQLGTPQASGVESHQQSSMKRGARSIDELRDFFLAEYGWQSVGPFRIGSLRDAPGLFECLGVEKPQGRETTRHATR